MVQISSTFVLATIAISAASSAMAFPLSQQTQQESRDLLLERRFWKVLKKGLGKVASIAGNFLREDEYDLALREDEVELFGRELSLEERSFWKSLKKGVGKVASVAAPIVSNFIREDEMELFGRELSLEERSFWKGLKKGLGKVASIAGNFIREDEFDLAAREDEMELFGRELSLEERSFWKGLKKGLGKVVSVAAPIVSNFIREDEYDLAAREDEMELFGRELSLEERSFWKGLKKGLGRVASVAAPIVSNFIREDGYDLAGRDYDDLVYGREYLDINELD